MNLLFVTGLFLTACSDYGDTQVTKMPSTADSVKQQRASTQRPIPRAQGSTKVVRGAKLFAEHCASCHGSRAQGGPLWSKVGPVSKNPSPPLNGTGHTWYHPATVLQRVIMEGTVRGNGMPPWRDKLSEDEVEAVIAWFQSLWSDEKYATSTRIEAQVRGNQITEQ